MSMSGLFKHFPTKEALVFDREDDIRAGLATAVRDCPSGTCALDCLRDMLLSIGTVPDDPQQQAFTELTASTPALRSYARRIWLSNEQALADALIEKSPNAPDAVIAARAIARFILDRAQPWHREDPQRAIDSTIDLLKNGWPAPELGHTPRPAPVTEPQSPARPAGLRERKKALTRRAITDTAVDLFTERGYDQVGVREIAEAAGVSIATLFTYFPDGKASLVFPGGQLTSRSAALVDAVRQRSTGQTIPQAVRDHMSTRGPFASDLNADQQRVLELVRTTPELRDFALNSSIASQDTLATAIAKEAGLAPDDMTARLLACCILQIPFLAQDDTAPRHTLDVVIDLLSRGWPACLSTVQRLE
ncbi:TetR/AcrR family transcriptional regulator [Streptomyces althioticus]|uniref:TetR/AcrR family transcriptional regulator n=1 Tax=Streptomyces althioticus TaxID=83380 RepID=UPI00368BB2EB